MFSFIPKFRSIPGLAKIWRQTRTKTGAQRQRRRTTWHRRISPLSSSLLIACTSRFDLPTLSSEQRTEQAPKCCSFYYVGLQSRGGVWKHLKTQFSDFFLDLLREMHTCRLSILCFPNDSDACEIWKPPVYLLCAWIACTCMCACVFVHRV